MKNKADIVTQNRDELLKILADRQPQELVEEIAHGITPVIETICLEKPSGAVVLALQWIADSLLASLIEDPEKPETWKQ